MLKREFLRGFAASAVACGCATPAFAQPGGKLRCGFVDPASHTGGLVPQSYGLKGAGRGKSSLTWSFSGSVPGVPTTQQVTTEITTAFAKWQAVVPGLTFSQVASNADISITTGTLAAGLLGLTTDDGRTITLASGQQFGATFATPGNVTGNSLLFACTHEIGHALGLLHATTTASIMFPVEQASESLGPDDKAAIKALYAWSTQKKLQGGTEQAPSLCLCGRTLAMAWRGSGDDHNIWVSTSTDGQNWTPQRPIRDVGTIGSPGLAWDGTRLWMVWRGSGDDGLYWKNTTDFFVSNNPAQASVAGGGSSHGPRIAVIGGVPTMVWKGIHDDSGIWFAQFVGGQWQKPANVPNVGTAAAPAICADLSGGARLLWRGTGDDQRLWTTFSTGVTPNWQPQSLLSWVIEGNAVTGTTGGGTAASATGPSLARFGNVVQAAWRGVNGDDGLWFTQLANDRLGRVTVPEWSSQAHASDGGSSDGPSIAFFGGQLHMVWKGVPNDTGLYSATL